MAVSLKAVAKKYVPFGISGILLLIIVLLVPWQQVWHELSHISWQTLVILTGLSLVFYVAKVVRFWYMLRRMNIHQPLSLVGLTYLAAQPVSLLPAGELYRCVMLERYTGVPVAKSSPTFLVQGLLEAVVLGTVTLVGVLILGRFRLPVVIGYAVLALLVILLRRGVLTNNPQIGQILNKLPFVQVSKASVRDFGRQNQVLLQPKVYAPLIAMTWIPELSGIAIAYVSIKDLGGDIGVIHAAIAYTLPIIITFFSFLPGGLGAQEQGSIGVLLLLGLSTSVAVAATLLVRFFTTGMGLILGFAAQAYLAATHDRKRGRGLTEPRPAA